MERKVVLDTNIIIKLILHEEDSDLAMELYNNLITNNYTIIAPSFLRIEAYSIILQKYKRKEIPRNFIKEAARALDRFDIEYTSDEELMGKSLDIAVDIGAPVIYDMLFLSLAWDREVILITEDRSFIRIANTYYPKIWNMKDSLHQI